MSEEIESGDSAFSVVSEGVRFKAAILAGHVVERMREKLPSQSKESVMETFGISSNTWTKIKRGQPIRQSTAEHLVRRLVCSRH